MRGWWREATGLVLPVECAGCGAPRVMLCERCRAVLLGGSAGRVRPSPTPRGLPVVYAAAAYAGACRSILLAHKERGALRLAGPLGAALALAVCAVVWRQAWSRGVRGVGVLRPILLVPVPSARRAVAARGHDPTRRIALAAARALRGQGVPARVLPVLRQRRTVVDQAGLGAAQRVANVSGVGVDPGAERLLSGGPVVLVDDLMTTGATLAEAARAVRVAMGWSASDRADDGSGGRDAAGKASGAWRGRASGAAVAGRTEIRVSAGAEWSGVPGALGVPGVGSAAVAEAPGVGPAREGLAGAAVVGPLAQRIRCESELLTNVRRCS